MADEEIRVLNPADAVAAGELLSSVFADDPGFRFVFPSTKARNRWLNPLLTAESRFVAGYGMVTGLSEPGSRQLKGVAMWYLPHRRFPPPWYRMLIPALPLLGLQVRLPTATRLGQLHKLFVSLLPKIGRYLYLEGLAVLPEHRGQGLGHQLVTWGQNYAQGHQCPMILHCWEPMIPYYQRQGFVSFSKKQLKGMDVHCHLMLWDPEVSEQSDRLDCG